MSDERTERLRRAAATGGTEEQDRYVQDVLRRYGGQDAARELVREEMERQQAERPDPPPQPALPAPSSSSSENNCCFGCATRIFGLLVFWAVFFGLPTPWGKLNIDVFPPRIWRMDQPVEAPGGK